MLLVTGIQGFVGNLLDSYGALVANGGGAPAERTILSQQYDFAGALTFSRYLNPVDIHTVRDLLTG